MTYSDYNHSDTRIIFDEIRHFWNLTMSTINYESRTPIAQACRPLRLVPSGINMSFCHQIIHGKINSCRNISDEKSISGLWPEKTHKVQKWDEQRLSTKCECLLIKYLWAQVIKCMRIWPNWMDAFHCQYQVH